MAVATLAVSACFAAHFSGEEFWFAPRAALEQGVYSGAFVSHGNVRVGDKRFGYGLSKGSIADVRLSGRVCLLNLDVEVSPTV